MRRGNAARAEIGGLWHAYMRRYAERQTVYEGRGSRFADGGVYEREGKRERGARHVSWYANGDVYEGEFKGEVREEGRGTYRFANGNVYEGEWKAGQPEGARHVSLCRRRGVRGRVEGG